MSVNIPIYNNTNGTTRTISFEFASSVLAYSGGADPTTDFYFKITTSARDTDNNNYPPRVVRSLSSFPLGTKRRISNSAAAYNTITELIEDFTYDYVYGHSANLYSTGVTEQKPMKF